MDNMTDKERDEYLNAILNEAGGNADNKAAAEASEKNVVEDKKPDKEESTSPDDKGENIAEEPEHPDLHSKSSADDIPEEEPFSDEPEDFLDELNSRGSKFEEEDEEYTHRGEEYDDGDQYDDEDDEGSSSARRKRKKKHSAGRLVFALVLTTLIVCISVGIAVFIINTVKSVTGLDRENIQMVVDIPENYNTTQIAALLENNDIIDNADLFVLMAKLKGVDSSFSAGSHILSPNMTFNDIMDELCKHYEEERESVDVTFPEGITVTDAANILEEAGVCEAERFIYIFNSSSFGFDFEKQVSTDADKFMKMEGFLFPDTYTFYVEEEAEVVAKKIYRNFENKLTPDYYGRMKDLGLSLEETVTLASMVQLEGKSTYDMKNIASVFLNRLKSDEYPKLESDPTKKYSENTIKPNQDIPDKQMLDDYNTYICEGLPPGPVCNPGLDAISAVLHPADTDYYFFCADLDTGEVFYAETLEEHEENLVKAHLKAAPVTAAEDTEEETEEAAE